MTSWMQSLIKHVGLKGASDRAKGFKRDEGGAMIVFGVTIFVMMLWVGGMAIDFMRFEYDRSRIAYTTDRAALAAASLNQPLEDCEAVALDYFEKAGLDTSRVIVKGSCNELSKTVLVAAETNVKSLFLNLMGIKSMTAGASSIAEEHSQDVEVSLVLDVSGSMSDPAAGGTETKLAALKGAVENFFDLMLTDENVGRVSINVIPYNMQVNAGKDVLDQLSVTDEHDYSHCVDFAEADFATVEITDTTAQAASLGDIDLSAPGEGFMSSGDELQRTGHFDPYWTTLDHPHISSDNNVSRQWVCPNDDWSTVTLMSQNKAALKKAINDFEAGGNTSTDIGIKWGSYFLNPNANRLIQNLPEGSLNITKIGEDPVDEDGNPVYDDEGTLVESPREIPEAFEDRPYSYTRENTRKILVVMSDGKNTTQVTLNEDYAEGDSDVWFSQNTNYVSHYKPMSGLDDYFMSYGNYYQDYFDDQRADQGGDTRYTWPEVWNHMGVKYLSYYFQYARQWNANAYWDFNDEVMSYISASDKDDRMQAACTAAHDAGVWVFTIGFEVSDHSADELEDCASEENDFYRAEGKTEIEEAFESIAKTIQRLQLTN